MEKRDLYDINRKLIGKTIFKGERIPDKNYIIVVLVFIQNSEGKFLIQKRSEIKNGKYATTGGHPKSGENSMQGIITEVKEELGLDFSNENFILYDSGCDGKDCYKMYFVNKDVDINNITIQKEEVASVCWLSIEEIKSLMQEDKFFKSHYEEFEILLKWLNKGDFKHGKKNE